MHQHPGHEPAPSLDADRPHRRRDPSHQHPGGGTQHDGALLHGPVALVRLAPSAQRLLALQRMAGNRVCSQLLAAPRDADLRRGSGEAPGRGTGTVSEHGAGGAKAAGRVPPPREVPGTPVRVQRYFAYRETPDQDLSADPAATARNALGIAVYTKGGEFSQDFLNWAHAQLLQYRTFADVKLSDVAGTLRGGHNAEAGVDIGASGAHLSLADALLAWLLGQYTQKRKFEGNLEDDRIDEAGRPAKRQKWSPQPLPGTPTGVPGRLKRTYSFADGAKHAPEFQFRGKHVSARTPINDNGTYSLAAYQVFNGKPKDIHLIGGSISGEHVGPAPADSDTTVQMHAEEQQLVLLDSQVEHDAHGLKDAVKNGKVVLHLHISKSPCSDRCQGLFKEYLDKYPGLQIQMYLELPYMANDPEDAMLREADALGKLMATYKGRLAYRVVSIHKGKKVVEDYHPDLATSALAASLVEQIDDRETLPDKVASRRLLFTKLEGKQLPGEGWVQALPRG